MTEWSIYVVRSSSLHYGTPQYIVMLRKNTHVELLLLVAIPRPVFV